MPFLTILTALRSHWKFAVMGLLALALAVQTVRYGAEKNVSGDLRVRLKEVVAERDSLIAAAKEADRLNAEQVKRIAADQQRITDDVEADLTARLERLRSELRAKADQGNSQRPATGPDGKAAGGTAEEARLCLTSDQLLRAAESEERHDQLITWVEKQLGVVR